jgi:hypothetical protein
MIVAAFAGVWIFGSTAVGFAVGRVIRARDANSI